MCPPPKYHCNVDVYSAMFARPRDWTQLTVLVEAANHYTNATDGIHNIIHTNLSQEWRKLQETNWWVIFF